MADGGIPTIDDLDLRGKRVLVRADLNVPMKDGRVTDATRLERAAETVVELSRKGAKVVVMSHFGRPKGRDEALSLRPVAAALGEFVSSGRVNFAADCIGPAAERAIAALAEGDVVVLENLRFHPGEEANDAQFARALAALGEVYVNDAFSCAHRAHASTEALAHLLPAAAGRTMQSELAALDRALDHPDRPVIAIVGGAKISTKIPVLENLLARVDTLVIGGAMANTFLFAMGHAVGRSLCEREMAETAKRVLAKAAERGAKIVLPVDVVVAKELAAHVPSEIVNIDRVPEEAMILDIGPRSASLIDARIDESRTLLWNGPMGAFETPPFERHTVAIARHVAERTRAGALISVAGGGDTVAALAVAGVAEGLSYVSTAGGAFLEWLEGRDLPGVAALRAAGARAQPAARSQIRPEQAR